MKRITYLVLITVLIGACQQDEILADDQYQCTDPVLSDEDNASAIKYQELIEFMVRQGLPGVMMTVMENESVGWSGAAGYADLASKVALEPCHITRVGSTVKTFTAVTILLLEEEGALSLNDQASQHLSPQQLEGLQAAPESTIRQLLNHSSGIYNYIINPRFQTASLNDPERIWYPEDLLHYARGEDPAFSRGSDVGYSNTNYVLLGMIIESVTGKPFYQVFEERLFQPLGLTYTQFAADDPVPDNIIRGYIDLYSNKQLINSTYYSGWDYFTADGGLISNSYDLAVFMRALFNGEVLQAQSLEEMLTWQRPSDLDEDGFITDYGLGIFRIETDYGPAYIHSGDAIGYFASMVYFPQQEVAISWAVNANYGKMDDIAQSKEAMEKIFSTVFSH